MKDHYRVKILTKICLLNYNNKLQIQNVATNGDYTQYILLTGHFYNRNIVVVNVPKMYPDLIQ